MGIAMDLFYSALVVLHVVGIVAIGYGFFKELAKKTFGVNVAMLHGASTQFLTGILMVGIHESGAIDIQGALDMNKITLKLIISIAVIAAYSIGKRKSGTKLYWALVGGLTTANIIIAVVI
jgi:hypothetical protein